MLFLKVIQKSIIYTIKEQCQQVVLKEHGKLKLNSTKDFPPGDFKYFIVK